MRSPAEAKLDFLVGKWVSSDRTYPGHFGPGGTSEGHASYAWDVGGTWIVYEFRTQLPDLGPYQLLGGLTYDPGSETYRSFTVNSLRNLLVYQGRWEEQDTLVFALVFPERKPDTRISYRRLPDGQIRMTSERPAAGGGRELYFETLLRRP